MAFDLGNQWGDKTIDWVSKFFLAWSSCPLSKQMKFTNMAHTWDCWVPRAKCQGQWYFVDRTMGMTRQSVKQHHTTWLLGASVSSSRWIWLNFRGMSLLEKDANEQKMLAVIEKAENLTNSAYCFLEIFNDTPMSSKAPIWAVRMLCAVASIDFHNKTQFTIYCKLLNWILSTSLGE